MLRIIFLVVVSAVQCNCVPIIAEGDTLTLIKSYSIEGSEYELVYEDESADSIIGGCGLFGDDKARPIVVNTGISNVPSKIVYIDKYGDITKIVTKNEYCEFTLLSDGRYVTNSGYETHGLNTRALTKSWYDGDDKRLFVLENTPGNVLKMPVSDSVLLSETHNVSSSCLNLAVVTGDYTVCELYAENGVANIIDYGLGEIIRPFNKDKDWFIVSDKERLSNNGETIYKRGTKVFDGAGNLKYVLSENVYPCHSGGGVRSIVYYGSDSYICQVGGYIELQDMGDGSEAYPLNPIPESNILEVYNGVREKLWDYEFPFNIDSHIFVSNNERYLLLVAGCYDRVVFDLKTGDIVYRVPVSKKGFVHSGYISDDGRTLAVETSANDGYSLEVFSERNRVAAFFSDYTNGRFAYGLSGPGRVLCLCSGGLFNVYTY